MTAMLMLQKICVITRLNSCKNQYAVSSTVSACGAEGSGLSSYWQVKPAARKQEINIKSLNVYV